MIIYKSPDEIARMRVAGRITADAIKAMLEQVTPGMTTADLDAIAEGTIRDAGGIPSFLGYKGTYPATICASVNDEIIGNVLTPVHVGPGSDTQPRVVLHVLAQDVAGRDLRDAEAICELRRLRSLPSARRAEEHETHGYFRKPS